MARVPRWLAGWLVIALAGSVVGCDQAGEDYFYRPSSVGVSLPTVRGDAVYLGLGTIEARPGDTVRLESLDAAGMVGFGEIRPVVRPMSEATGGGIGAVTEATLAEAIGVGPEAFLPLAGYEFDAADGPIEVVVRLAGDDESGRFDTVILTFRVNGGKARSQDMKFVGSACFAPTQPPSSAIPCDPPEIDLD